MRRFKNEPGDWVAVPVQDPRAGNVRPGKVVAADRDYVTVSVRIQGGDMTLTFEDPLPRIRWTGSRGSRRWEYAR